MIKPSPIEIAVAINATNQPWFMCKWFEYIDENDKPGKYLGCDGPLTQFEAAELAFTNEEVLSSAPYGVFFSNLHPSGLVVEISKFPTHLKIVNPELAKQSLLGLIRQAFNL